MNNDNYILIGMPASGKSTAGVILAKIIGYSFVDCDIVIQNSTGKRLSSIISEKGIDGFIQTENRINAGLKAHKTVISTGGSAVYGLEEMENFKELGTVIYLKVDFDELEKRLGDIKARGVVVRDGQSLRDLYNERIPLYEQYADIIIEEKNSSCEKVIDKIMKKIEPLT